MWTQKEKKSMAKGKAKVVYLGREGLVTHQTAPDWSFIYVASAVKDPNWNIGDVVELSNGKGFVYCKSGGVCYTGQGNMVNNAIPATGIDYANNVAVAAAIGATSVSITNGATVAQTEDGLRGGTILLKTASGSDNTALQCRGIIGNTAAAINVATTIYLDAPLTGALSTASYAYCMPSPYSDVRLAVGNGVQAIIGPAATYVSASGKYFWCQFKGRVMGVACQSGVGTANWQREVVWRHDGSLQPRGTTVTPAIDGGNGQVAGYVVDNNAALNGGTEIMLTGNV
jgi:hypothetical protein